MNEKNFKLLALKEKLDNSYQHLQAAFADDEADGICISDVEFALAEHNAILEELDELLS